MNTHCPPPAQTPDDATGRSENYAPGRRKGAVSFAFVRPSVRMFVRLSVRRVHSE